MLSIVPGGSTSGSRKSSVTSKGPAFLGVIASLTQPSAPPRPSSSKAPPHAHSGRRVVTSAPSGLMATETNKKGDSVRDRLKFTGDASIEELDRILEDDALQLLNIKKEITTVQNDELLKARATLMAIRKNYDVLFVANNAKEKELQSFLVRHQSLVEVDMATSTTQSSAQGVMADLQEQTTKVLEDLAAEQRTIKMQTLMIKRLDEEIGKCRLDIAKANISVEHAKHDMNLAESNMQINRQYLLEQDAQLEKLNASFKARREQRDSKIQMLHGLSVEGEHSVTKLQQSLLDTTKRAASSAATKRKQTATGKIVGNKPTNEDEDDDLGDSASLSTRAKRMTIAQIREALQRLQSQGARVERLQQLDQELRNNVLSQQKKKQELSEHLTQTQMKIQQLASNRQIYQEVDLKDAALAATSKECEEAKERDFRLKLNIEEMKQSIPRFLTKVTKVVHPQPNENQLCDAILKLEDELIKLIKVIGSALLKDATPDDLAMMSQQSNGSGGSDTNSEYARLQRLPGFSRLKRQLFFNMMTARPDVSDSNIRVEHPSMKGEKPKSRVSPRARRGIQGEVSSANSNEDDDDTFNASAVLDDHEVPSLGRTTIKNISRLIIDRDGPKLKPAEESSNKHNRSIRR